MTQTLRRANRNYYLLIIGFVSGVKYYKFAESNKSKALSLKRKFDLQRVPTQLILIEPKQSNNKQLSMFDNWIRA